jgi:uridine kinase
MKDKALLIAIDGLAGSGKSTLAKELQGLYGEIQIVEMDSFFLPLNKRVPFYSEKSAHLEYDYESLLSKVILPFKKGIATSYLKYNWVTDDIGSEKFDINPNKTLVIDGITSLHPKIQECVLFDYRIFVECDAKTRFGRVKKRDDIVAENFGGYNDKTRDYFENEWIPMEENYFKKYRPDKVSDLICKIRDRDV